MGAGRGQDVLGLPSAEDENRAMHGDRVGKPAREGETSWRLAERVRPGTAGTLSGQGTSDKTQEA
jgi:hypothetical protein